MMFRSLLVVALSAAVASAASLYDQPSSGGRDGYGTQADTYQAPSSSSGGYHEEQHQSMQMKRVCKPHYETKHDDHCESYNERVCRTFQQENCNDVQDKNCRAIVTSRQIRKCFNVTELLCSLKEDVQYEVVQVGSTIQKCHKVSERVCDTVYETQMSTRDDFQCRNINNPVCVNEERTIYDQTCKTTVNFECEMQQYAAPSPGGYESTDSYGSSSGGDSGYESPSTDSYGSSSGGDSGYGGSSSGGDSYGAPAPQPQSKPVCHRKPDTNCYKTPRTVTVQNCHSKMEKVCEKMPEATPQMQEKQNCHNEDKKVCELEERSQPKQVRKYVYTKQCRSIPRRVCANSDVKSLVPSCVGITRKQCSYTPVEQCEDIPKKHCFKTTRQVKSERCEMVATPSYAAPTPSYGSPAPTPSYGSPAPTPSYGSPAPTPSYGGGAPAPSYGGSAPAPSYGGESSDSGYGGDSGSGYSAPQQNQGYNGGH